MRPCTLVRLGSDEFLTTASGQSEKTTARQDQARQSSTGEGAGNRNSSGIANEADDAGVARVHAVERNDLLITLIVAS